MKKIQKAIILVLTLALLIGIVPVEGYAAVTDKRSIISEYKLSSYPRFPKLVNKQQYYVIYNESYRKGRVEVCFFDIINKADLMHVMWQGKNKAIDINYGEIANDEKYYLDSVNKKWIKFESGWGQISTGASAVKSSNLAIYNSNGNKILKPTKIDYLYFENTSLKIDKGDVFTLKTKTNLGTLKFSSSNPKVVSVSSKGKIKGLKKGTAVITAKAKNGKKATCKIVVR